MPAAAGLCAQGRGAPPAPARRTVSTRSACVILAARAAGPACAAASAIACSRSTRSLSALSMRWSASARRARSSVGTGSDARFQPRLGQRAASASVRRVSIAMRALSPSARGSRVRSHSSAKRTVSRCRQIRPSACARRRPSGPRRVAHARSVVRAGSKANGRRPPRARTRSRSRPWWSASIFDRERPRRPGFRVRQRLVR